MNRRKFLSLTGLSSASLLASCAGPAPEPSSAPRPMASGPFALGIDVLREHDFNLLRGKRVGLITNQTSVDSRGTPTRVVLKRALGPAFTTLFTPEHGLDGREPAGYHVGSRRDPLTGLIAYSLYGDTRKPTPAMLSNVDAVCFDLQDIGSRSYTYISTMAVAMEACGQAGKQFVVLDRPNPVGGLKVQGPPREDRWKSFVGQIPVPYLHGMTAGELARMGNARGWWAARPHLTVVPMRGWQRSMTWRDTGLRWIPTSPNIPNVDSPFYYAATGILGGLDGVDIGIGTARPFEYAGGKGINPNEFASSLSRMGIPGVRFSPYVSARKPGFAGAALSIDPHGSTDLIALAVVLTCEMVRRTAGAPLRASRGDTVTLFNKVWGSDSLWRDLHSGRRPGQIIAGFQGYARSFEGMRQGYLLY
jgi:uncharacterized protein YbbC (DUF1343 family)